MLCQVCKKKEATVHYTELLNNKVTEIHVCEKCALDKGLSVKPHFLLADLMAGLVGAEKGTDATRDRRCPNCGLTYSGFKSSGRLGCARCYETFEDSLGVLLEKIHGCSLHTGKVPGAVVKEVDKKLVLKKLRDRLQKLVETEAFEEAAHVRDEIKRLESKDKGLRSKTQTSDQRP